MPLQQFHFLRMAMAYPALPCTDWLILAAFFNFIGTVSNNVVGGACFRQATKKNVGCVPDMATV